jgi:predicted secreted protein
MLKLFVFAALVCSCAGFRSESSGRYENRLVIELDGNRTTGYSWTYTMEPDNIAREVSSEYKDASGTADRVGAGGVFQFAFEGIKQGAAELRFSYARPWESGIEPVKTTVYTLTVDKHGRINAVLKPSEQ